MKMKNKRKKKGFTLVELLVVIAIIALLMSILMPALARVRMYANRVFCGTNLSGIGKAMMIYANEDKYQELPRPGFYDTTWATDGIISDFAHEDREQAFADGTATVTSALYLLIKYADGSAEQFVCPGDTAKEFEVSDSGSSTTDAAELWDFGEDTTRPPGTFCSYAYQFPFSFNYNILRNYPLDTGSSSLMPVCADRNPYLDIQAKSYIEGADGDDETPDFAHNDLQDPDHTMNAASHGREGQNVLKMDVSVQWCEKPNVGILNDNIYKYWPTNPGESPPGNEGRQFGDSQSPGDFVPLNQETFPRGTEDAFLVSEINGDSSDLTSGG